MQEINDIAKVLAAKAQTIHHVEYLKGANELLNITSRLCKLGFLPNSLEDVKQESDTLGQFEGQKENYFYIKLGGQRGGFTLIDLKHQDLAWLKWHMDRNYIERTERDPITGKVKRIALHQMILERKLGRKLNKGMETHHIDRNRWNNLEENLVELPKDQNSRIKGKHIDNTSGYLGVSRNNSKTNPWKAEFYRHGKRDIKYFPTAEEGAAWYAEMAQQYMEAGESQQ